MRQFSVKTLLPQTSRFGPRKDQGISLLRSKINSRNEQVEGFHTNIPASHHKDRLWTGQKHIKFRLQGTHLHISVLNTDTTSFLLN